ncbi:peptidase inhibitor family I36 protein [Nocardia sp. NPDC058497]|uniref:peptidase inhibitor family I36 protein n=1 Tax=Nocardia sp. NPDC058497 TaxID=3346529 RepID=UPI00365EB022
MQKVFAVVLALVVGFGVVGCEHDAAGEDTAKVVKDVVCEMVVPIVDAVVVKMKAGVTVSAVVIAGATGLVLSKACEILLDRIGQAPDEEHEVTLDNGKGSQTTKITGNTFTSVTQDGCDRTGGCPTSYVCLFTGSEGTGKMSLFKIGSPDLGNQHIDAATVSVYNRTGKTATLFAARNNKGDTYTIEKSDKGDLPADWQATARSITVGPLPTTTSSTTTGPSTPPPSTSRTPSSSTPSTSKTSTAVPTS